MCHGAVIENQGLRTTGSLLHPTTQSAVFLETLAVDHLANK
jgi:hypothetical protein